MADSWENKVTKTYMAIPEWGRWILFIPLSIIVAIVFSFVFILGAHTSGVFGFMIHITHATAFQCAFLFFIYLTAPRAKLELVIVFTVLRSLILLLMLVTPILYLLGQKDVFADDFLVGLVSEIVILGCSISIYRHLKKEPLSP